MTETEEKYSSKVRTRVPTFDGDKAKWPFYRKKLESHLLSTKWIVRATHEESGWCCGKWRLHCSFRSKRRSERKGEEDSKDEPESSWHLVEFDSHRYRKVTMIRFHPWFSPRIRVVSRVLDQELMCASKEKIQDPIRNAKWNGNAEFPCRVLSRCCVILRACGNKSIRHDETCAPCKQSCQWRCRSRWYIRSNMELFLW